MPPGPSLGLGDQLLLDGDDYQVVELLVGRTGRVTFRLATVRPSLGGPPRLLLQLDDEVLEAHSLPPDALAGESVELEGRTLRRRWEDRLRIERGAWQGRTRFGRGRCAWYTADDGSVAVVVEERDERDAVVGAPLAPSRIDLRFTQGLR